MRCVLDTNVVLDWLVFEDPATDKLQHLVTDSAVQIVTTPLLIEELQRVLAYPQLQLDAGTRASVLTRYTSQTADAPVHTDFSRGNLLLPAGFPLCRDHDDDLFLALAYHTQADALVTKDKQLLALKRRAAKFGVNIVSVASLATSC